MPRSVIAKGEARIRSRVFVPSPAQRPIWNSDARILAAIAGTFGGKSHMGAYWLIREAHRYPGEDFIVCGPTYGNLKKAAIPKLLSLFDTFGLPTYYDEHARVGYRTGDREYRLPGGGIIYFVSADRPGSMQGAHIRGAWMDETVNTSYEVYETLRQRVAGLQGRILITTTPYDMGWLYQEVYQRWKAGDPDIFVHQWRSIDNPKFSKEQFEKERASMHKWRFRMLYEGEFERPEGLVYDCFRDQHWVDPFPIPDEWDTVLGIDWGFTDPMVILWEARAPSNKRFLYDELYRTGWQGRVTGEDEDIVEDIDPRGAYVFPLEMLEAAVKRCKDRNIKPKAVYCGQDEPGYIEAAKKLFADIGCYNVYGAKNAVVPGIERCYGLVRRGDLFVFNSLHNFRDEQGKYQWKIDNKTWQPLRRAEPIDSHNHAMDAWRYLEAGGKDEKENTFGVGKITQGGYLGTRAAMREGW